MQLMAELKSNEYYVAGQHMKPCVVINGMGQINYGLYTSACKLINNNNNNNNNITCCGTI